MASILSSIPSNFFSGFVFPSALCHFDILAHAPLNWPEDEEGGSLHIFSPLLWNAQVFVSLCGQRLWRPSAVKEQILNITVCNPGTMMCQCRYKLFLCYSESDFFKKSDSITAFRIRGARRSGELRGVIFRGRKKLVTCDKQP